MFRKLSDISDTTSLSQNADATRMPPALGHHIRLPPWFFDRWHITSCTETQSCISDTAMRHTWAVARSRCDTRPLSHELTTTHPACRTCVLRHPCRASSGTGNVIADLRHNLRVAWSGLRHPRCIAGHQCDTPGLSHARTTTLQSCRTQLLRYTMCVAHTVCDTRIVPLEAV